MAKPYGVPGVVRKWHSTPSLRNLVAEGAESIKDVFNSQNRVIPPWIARGSRKILTEIKDAIDEGRTLRPEDLPQGVSSGQLTTGKASARNKMVEWAVNFQSTFAQVASLNSRRRAAQLDFIDYLDTKLSGEIADLEGVNGFLGLDNETVLAVKPIFDTRRALRTIRKDIQGRSWATPTKLTKIPGFTAGRPKDVLHWARTFVDEIELYKTIRESGEDVPATMDRLANLLAAGDETAVTEVAQLVTREFLDAPGVRMRRVVFDPASGEALSPSRVRKIKAERQEYVRSLRSERAAARSRRVSAEQEQAQAILNARMEQTGFGQTNLAQLKTVDTNLPGEWRELLKGVKLERNLDGLPIELEETVARMRARALRAEPGERAKIQKEIGEIERVMDKADEALAEVNIRSMDLHDGSLHTQIKVLENAAKDIRDNMIGVAERNRLLLTRLLKEGPEVRKGFTQALRAQEDVGATWPIEKLRRHAPLRFVGIGNTKDDVIQFLLEESQALREHLLGDMVRSGIINEADRLALIQAYAPSLKGVFELEKLIGGGPKDAKAGFTSLRRPKLDAFELRRHPTQWTATVSLKDGGFSTRHFMNQEGAVRWMADHGVDPNDIPLTAQEWRGKTALGDSARIAGPLGKEIAAALMPIEPGVGLFARMEQLLTDMSFRKFQNMLARTFSDWVIENDAYNKLKANGASQRDLDRYVFVDRARRLGPLSDRWVHTDALNAYRRFTDSHLLMKDLAKEMQELTSSIDLVSRSLRRAGNTLETVGSAANDAIVSNLIVSRPATVANNIMGDMFLYVMPHTPRLLTSLGGWKILGETAWDLVGPLFGKGRYSDEVLLLKRMGVLDDTLADVAQPRTVREPLLEGILGKDPRGYVRPVFGVSESANPQPGELAKRLDSVEKLIDSESFNRMSPGKQRKLLNAAVTMREKLNKRLPKSMMGTVRRQLVDLFQRLSLGRPGGSFDEVTRVGRELYGALNNVLRVAVYRYRTRTLGESPEEAMHVVRHAMQTYSRAPTFTRRLARSVPGSPVISYRYEHLRILMWNLTNNFAGTAGAWSAMAAHNFMALAQSGVDPARYLELLESDDPSQPAAISLATRVIAPTAGGDLRSISMPGMDFAGLFTQENALLRQLADEQFKDKTVMGQMGVAMRNYLLGYFGGNPVASFAYSALTGRSSRTGQYTTNRSKHIMEELYHHGVRTMVPPMFPGGEWTQDLVDVVKRPGRKLTGRRVSLANAMIQKTVGLRIRGANVPGAEAIAKVAGLWTFGQVPIRNLPEEPYNEEDLVAGIYFNSAAVDPTADDPMVTIRSNLDARMRSAAQYQQSEFDEERQFGNKWMGQLLDEYSKMGGIEREIELGTLPEGELQKKLVSLLRGGKRDEYFANMSVVRKADVIRKLHALTGNDGLVWDHVMAMGLRDKGGVRTPTDPDSVRAAMAMLDNYLADPPRHEGLENVQVARSLLEVMLPNADISRMKESVTDEDWIEARRLLEAAK
jgi:hypothetical protein